MRNQLIFIDGVSGVGKTTMARLLQEELRKKGCAATCHFEGDHDNPLDPFQGTYPPKMPINGFTEAYVHCWQHFVDGGQGSSLILDGTLLHHQINDLIRNYGAAEEAILEHLTTVLRTIQGLNGMVFYLSSGNVRQRLIHAQESRGKPIPRDEQIAFWENRKAIDLYILDKLPIKTHTIGIDRGWDVALDRILKQVL